MTTERQQQLAGIPINESLHKDDVLSAIRELRSARSKTDDLTRGEIVELLNQDEVSSLTTQDEVTKVVDQLVKEKKVVYTKHGIELLDLDYMKEQLSRIGKQFKEEFNVDEIQLDYIGYIEDSEGYVAVYGTDNGSITAWFKWQGQRVTIKSSNDYSTKSSKGVEKLNSKYSKLVEIYSW